MVNSIGATLVATAAMCSQTVSAQSFEANEYGSSARQISVIERNQGDAIVASAASPESVIITQSATQTTAKATKQAANPTETEKQTVRTRKASLVEEGSEFTFILSPYVWIPSVTGDVGLGTQGLPLNLDAGDLLDVFELGGLVRGEVRHASGWGVSADYIFANLGTGFDILIGDADADIDAGILELAVIRRFESGADAIDVYAGIRRWDADVDVAFQTFLFSGNVAVGDQWTDPLVGVRYLHPVSPRWRLIAQGDVGGFGAGSEFSWNAALGVSYASSDHMQFQVVYRALNVDRESPAIGGGSPVDIDLTIAGPLIGFAFRF